MTRQRSEKVTVLNDVLMYPLHIANNLVGFFKETFGYQLDLVTKFVKVESKKISHCSNLQWFGWEKSSFLYTGFVQAFCIFLFKSIKTVEPSNLFTD